MSKEALEIIASLCADKVLTKDEENILRKALAKQEQKYRRGDRLVCLETDEFCVIHISGVDRQWVKFPDSHIGVYTNDQIADMFELLAKEQEQKRPQNCGTSYCSCIECVMEQEQGEPVATCNGMPAYEGPLSKQQRKFFIDEETASLVKECRDAFAEELSAWDIEPPLHHIQQGHDNCVKWLAAHGIKE